VPLPLNRVMLTLYDYGPSANCLKVRVLLRQLGLEYERVPVDIFAGESRAASYLTLNPAGRTPALLLRGGDAIAESNAILLYLADGTPFLPDDRVDRAHVHQWLFFEQNLLEPNVGTARFWRLTGREQQRPEAFARHFEAGLDALRILDDYLAGCEFLVGGSYTVADVAMYAYTHVAHEAGIDMAAYPAIAPWLARVEDTEEFVNDLDPYRRTPGFQPESRRPETQFP
jgi:glutathione S-transferase